MSTQKKVIKTTQKTEPAAAKKGTKPAAPKTDGKKNVTPAKETATPAPAPDLELQTKLEILEQSNAELKADLLDMQRAKQAAERADTAKRAAQAQVSAVKLQNETLKERVRDLEDKVKYWVDNVGDRVGNTAEDVAGFGEKVNKQTSRKWVGVGLAILLFIAIVFAVVYRVQRDNAGPIIKAKRDSIDMLLLNQKTERDAKPYDSTHQTNNGVKRPDVSAVEKKSPVTNR